MTDIDFIRGFYSGVLVMGNATTNVTVDLLNDKVTVTIGGNLVHEWS